MFPSFSSFFFKVTETSAPSAPRLLTPAELAKKKKYLSHTLSTNLTITNAIFRLAAEAAAASSSSAVSLGAKAAELSAKHQQNGIPTSSSSSSIGEVNTEALAAAIVSALKHCDLSGPTPYVRILRNPM